MEPLQRHSKPKAINRSIAIIAGAALTALFSAPLEAAQAEPAAQISISTAQIQRAGIQTEAAVAAGSAPAKAEAPAGESGQHLSGTVTAPTNAVTVVSTVVSGVVQKIHVNSLQQVQPGTPIATLFSQQLMEMQREYLQLAIQSRLSQEKLARDENLLKEGIISQARVQDSRGSALQSNIAAKERYQSLRAAGLGDGAIRKMVSSNALSPYLTVSAGVSGSLLELNMNIGQRIEAGMPIARISKDAALWIELQASRPQAAQMRVGDLLQIKGCGAALVIAISPQVNGANQSTLIRAQQTVNDGCLQLNQYVEASHTGSSVAAGSVGVPASAIVRNGSDAFVFVKNAQGFEAVKVRVAPGPADKVWVTGKLKAGSQVAMKGIVALKGAWIGLGSDGLDVASQPDGKKDGAQ